MQIDRDAVQRVIELLAESEAGEIEIEDGETSVRVRSAAAVFDESAASPTPAGEELPEGGAPGLEPVEAPMKPEEPEGKIEYVVAGLVGLFHRGRTPDEEPMVEIGDNVSEGQVIGTIEALRKLTDVVSTVDGEVVDVLVADGEAVQYGDRLFAIRVEEA